MARIAMIDANLPPSVWPYAEAWAVKILSILPTTANENSETPHSKIGRLLGLHKFIVRFFSIFAFLELLLGFSSRARKLQQKATKWHYAQSRADI